MNSESSTSITSATEPATENSIRQDVIFPNPHQSSFFDTNIEPASVCCPSCFYPTPLWTGYSRKKDKTGNVRRPLALARLYVCPHCGRHFVTAERVDSDPMPTIGKSPIGDRLESSITTRNEERLNHISSRVKNGRIIATNASVRCGVYPVSNGNIRLVFPDVQSARRLLDNLTGAVCYWEETQKTAPVLLDVPPVCYPVDDTSDELDPQAEPATESESDAFGSDTQKEE